MESKCLQPNDLKDVKYHYSSDSSDDSDDSVKSKIKSSQLNSGGRLPTRRPNPNVFNRNALMARENRRKKKEYIEMLERDVEKQRKINKKLHKMIKHQAEYVKTLKNERNYFKSILANKTQILSLVNLVRTAAVSQSDESEYKECKKSSSLSPNSSPAQQLEDYLLSDEYDNGTVNNNNDPTLSVLDNPDIFFTDYNLPALSDCNNWDDLLNDTNPHSFGMFETKNETKYSNYSIINDEHSYFSSINKSSSSTSNEEAEADSGVCLHISGGKFSLEFCATCHEKSKIPVIQDF